MENLNHTYCTETRDRLAYLGLTVESSDGEIGVVAANGARAIDASGECGDRMSDIDLNVFLDGVEFGLYMRDCD